MGFVIQVSWNLLLHDHFKLLAPKIYILLFLKMVQPALLEDEGLIFCAQDEDFYNFTILFLPGKSHLMKSLNGSKKIQDVPVLFPM